MTARRVRWIILLAALLTAPCGPVYARSGRAEPTRAPAPKRVAIPAEWSGEDVRVSFHRATGFVRFVGAAPGRPIPHPGRPAAPPGMARRAESHARAFLAGYGSLFGLEDPERDLVAVRETRSGARRAVRFQQVHRGIPILGGEIVVQTDEGGNAIAATGEILPAIALDTAPGLDPATARRLAIDAVSAARGADPAALDAGDASLWIVDPALLRPADGAARLAWRVDVRARAPVPMDELVMIDAVTGGVVLEFDQLPTALLRRTYDAANGTTLPGTLVCDESNPTCAGGGAHEEAAHRHIGDAYAFYAAHHGRDSVDDAGLELITSVHYGVSYANAYWDGVLEQFVFGDAHGYPLADDVVGHEYTHGVTSHESRLFYYYQSGAINESLSDIWGEFIDLTNGTGNDTAGARWLVGEDIAGAGAGRDMENPPAYSQPDRMSSLHYWLGTGDQGGVHTNSGIGNKAAFLMTDGGSFNGRTVSALGIDKVALIWYEAQRNLLVSGSDYADLADALQQACLNLAGTGGIAAADCVEVGDATAAVEMSDPAPGSFGDAPVCAAGDTVETYVDDDIDANGGSRFTPGVGTGTSSWLVYWAFATSGALHLQADDCNPGSDSWTAMNEDVTLPSGTSYLRFDHSYHFQNNGFVFNDGGILEYSTNHGSTWSDAFPLFDYNMYTGWIADDVSNPLHGRTAFVGVSGGYTASRLDLTPLAGQPVRFRWRMGTDASGCALGWSVDDVMVYRCRPANIPPNPPSTPAPANGASGVSRAPTLTWTGGDPNPGDVVTYDVHFGTASPPPLAIAGRTTAAWAPGALDESTVHYWKIVARDDRGSVTEGPIWSFTTAAGPVCGDPLLDGGFEGGTPSASWTEYASTRPTPLCSFGTCYTFGARTGNWWARLGTSSSGPESSYVEQTVTLPDGSATLAFYLSIAYRSGNGTDRIRALIDGVEVFRAYESDARFTMGYARVEVNLSAFADGGAHTLRLESTGNGIPWGTAFHVDDVSLASCAAPAITLRFTAVDRLEWQTGTGYSAWNLYRGDQHVLRAGGPYTQEPGSNPLAGRSCGLTGSWITETTVPDPGRAAFFVMAGIMGGMEKSLGSDSAGSDRPCTSPCP